MTFSSYDPYTRYRRRTVDRLKGVLTTVFFVGLAFAMGFWLGGQGSQYEIAMLKTQISASAAQQQALEDALTRTQAGATTAKMRFEQLQETVEEAIPAGPMEQMVELLKKQLESGVDPKRLEFAIRSSRPPQNCSEPQTARFVVTTPAYQGPENKVDIAEGAISVSGTGDSARSVTGAEEAWFDPTRRIKVKFTTKDGRMDEKSGVMPLHNTIVVGGREYRFTIEEGTKSFAKVTYDSCDYP